MLRVVAALAVLILTIYTAIDCAQTETGKVKGMPKGAWLAVIILFPVVGPAGWWIAGRPDGLPGSGGGPQDRPRGGGGRGPIGPDDDPDFLRRL